MSNEVAFVNWWSREFPDLACPPLPKNVSELTLTAQMAMRTSAPELYTALFAGGEQAAPLPADVSVRLNSGTLQPGDAGALRAAGFEMHAQRCERWGEAQQDRRMADQAASSRENYQQAVARSAALSEMSLLERLALEPLTPDQIASNRRRYGVTGK